MFVGAHATVFLQSPGQNGRENSAEIGSDPGFAGRDSF